jgi:hypothetical protein
MRSPRVALALLLLFSAGCADAFAALGADCVETSTQAVTRERTLPGFTRIASKSSVDLRLGIGPKQVVRVVAPAELDRLITTKVVRGVLEIDAEGCWSSRTPPRVEIEVPSLEGLSLQGSGDAIGTTPIRGKDLAVAVAGSGSIKLEVALERALQVAVAGSGDIDLRGRAAEVKASVAGSGDIDAGGLAVGAAAVNVAGSGDVEVAPSRSLTATIAGSGDVVYRGSPEVRQNVVGSGEVLRVPHGAPLRGGARRAR